MLLAAGAVRGKRIFLRLPLMQQVNIVVGTAQRSAATVRSKRISDHWKEIVLPAYSLRIAGTLRYFFLLLCMAVLPVALAGLAAPGGMAHWLKLLMRPFAIAILCLARSSTFSCERGRAWLTIHSSINCCTDWRWGRGSAPRCSTTWNAEPSLSLRRSTTAATYS